MESTLKTVRQWLETLPEPHKTVAISEMERQNSDRRNAGLLQVPDLHSAIDFAFQWEQSTQGKQYWEDIYVMALTGELDTQPTKQQF